MSETRIYIKDKLAASGKSQGQIAAELGVTHGAMSQWASGLTMPSARLLPALASALGCTVDALYGEEAGDDAVHQTEN